MFVSDLRDFLGITDDAPGPARKMAEHLGFVVRAATAADAGNSWLTALTCRRRPGNRPCTGHIAVFRADLPAPIQWQCSACGDEGVISGWEDSPFDLRQPRSRSSHEARQETVLADEAASALRDLRLLDTDCERLVFRMHSSDEGAVLAASADEFDVLLGFVAAEANHETNRRRRKRLDETFAALSDALEDVESAVGPSSSAKITGRTAGVAQDSGALTGKWSIVEMELWDRDDLDMVAPAFVEFRPDLTGSFGFLAVTGGLDFRRALAGGAGVEFSWEGIDEGDQVSGRGSAALQDDGSLHGRIYFHLGDDSGFRAQRYRQ
jgi:hypothetical protein